MMEGTRSGGDTAHRATTHRKRAAFVQHQPWDRLREPDSLDTWGAEARAGVFCSCVEGTCSTCRRSKTVRDRHNGITS